jgi:hypothetical protein
MAKEKEQATLETLKTLEAWEDEQAFRIEPCSDGSGQFDVHVYGKRKRVCAVSLYLFPVTGQVRQKIIQITEHVWFDRFILALIIANSIFLSLYDWRNLDAPENKVMESADPVLLTFFTLECFLKVAAMGMFLDQNSYLRDGWNWLDFVVVVTGLVGVLPLDGSLDLSFLRVFRVLRPLRSLTVMPEMRVLVNTVLRSIPRLADVLGMALFLFLIFGIMGINFWGGVLFRQCRVTEKPVFNQEDNCWSWPVYPDESDSGFVERLCGGRYMCEDLTPSVCGSPYPEDSIAEFRPTFDGKDTTELPWCEDTMNYGKEQTYIAAFNFRQTHFDHLAAAILVIIQCTTLEGWTDIMYMLEDSYSEWFAPVYFFILIFITSFFLLNVALAVIWEAYSELSEDSDDGGEEEGAGAQDAVASPTGATAAWASGTDNKENEGESAEEKDKPDEEEDDNALDDDFEEVMLEAPWIDCAPVRFCRLIAFNEVFVSVIMFFITANVGTMMIDQHPPPNATERLALEYCGIIFNTVFTIEMVINLIAMGPKRYWTNPVTAFDGVIVIVSLISWMGLGGGGGAARAFRGFRLLRIFRLAKKWTSFRILLKSMAVTAKAMGNFTVLLVLMMYVFTLMAMSFFATSFHFDYDNGGHHMPELAGKGYCGPTKIDGSDNLDCVPRAHFDTFLWAFVTIFQILSGENWNTVMYDGMEAGGWGAVFFFLMLIIVGQCIILNLFLALLMAKFEDSSSNIREQEKENEEKKKKAPRQEKGNSPVAKSEEYGGMKIESVDAADVTENPAKEATHGPRSAADADEDGAKHAQPATEDTVVEEKEGPFKLPGQPESPRNKPDSPKNPKQVGTFAAEASAEATPKSIWHQESGMPKEEKGAPTWPWNYSFLVLHPENPLRVAMTQLRTHKYFDNFILVCIIISSLCMAADSPLADPSSPLPTTLKVLGMIFSIVFTIEMTVKMLSMGFILGKHAYWRSAWNILDGVVVVVSLIDLLNIGSGMKALKTLRILRALRPLRVISRNENLKLVVNTLFKSIPELANLLIVGFLFFLIFALFAVSNFKGTYYSCFQQGYDDLSYDRAVTLIEASNGSYYTPLGELGAANLALGALLKETTVPLCYHADGLTNPIGHFDEDLERYVVNDAAACESMGGVAIRRRPVADMPICVAHCNPTSDPEHPRPAVCPKPPATVEGLPSVCPDEDRAFEELSAEEQDGVQYFEAMKKRHVMACGGTDTFKGCQETYCPNVDQDTITGCVDECETHPDYCIDSCDSEKGLEGSATCKECREQCQAACSCSEFCDAYIYDAASCVEQGGHWFPTLNQDFNNIATAMLTLFEISTTEGWVDVMYSACDARGPYMQPVRDVQELWSLFFVFFILVGSFFILQLCVGVIIDNFSQIKEEGQELMLTDAQRHWIDATRQLMSRKIFFGITDLQNHGHLRRKIYFLVSNSKFDNAIMSCILANTVVMGMKTFPSPSQDYKVALMSLNYVFAGIFFCECILKIFALRRNYFRDAWNKFDFTCVCASIVSIGITLGTSLEIGSVMSAIRLFRIARLFRVVKFAKGLNRLFTAFILSIPKLLNVAAILFLLLFLFSVLGVTLFAKVKFEGTHDVYGNFRDLGRGFTTLIRSMTGEAWNEIMHSLSKNEFYFMQIMGDNCYDADLMDVTEESYPILDKKCLIEDPQMCGTPMAYVFFVLYTCLITFVILNLVIAVILEGFEESSTNDEADLVSVCIDIWGKYDPNFTMVLPLADIYRFVGEVASHSNEGLVRPLPNLKTKDPDTRLVDIGQIPMWVATCCDVKLDENQNMHFIDVVKVVLSMVLSCNDPSVLTELKSCTENDEKVKNQLEELEKQQKARHKYDILASKEGCTDLKQDVAVTKIAGLLRIIKAKRRVRMLVEEIKRRQAASEPPKAG